MGGSDPALDKLTVLMNACEGQLSITTKAGSPLWYGFETQSNVEACLALQSAGGEVVAPSDYYAELERKDKVIAAVKHSDRKTLEENYQSEDYFHVLYYALDHQSCAIVEWVSGFSPVDWHATVGNHLDFGDDNEVSGAHRPFWEIPFVCRNDGPAFDAGLVRLIVDQVDPDPAVLSVLATYVAGIKDFSSGNALLTSLKERGADLDRRCLTDFDTSADAAISPLENSIWRSNLAGFKHLLEAGVDHSPKAFRYGDDIEEAIASSLEGDEKKLARKIWKEFVN